MKSFITKRCRKDTICNMNHVLALNYKLGNLISRYLFALEVLIC